MSIVGFISNIICHMRESSLVFLIYSEFIFTHIAESYQIISLHFQPWWKRDWKLEPLCSIDICLVKNLEYNTPGERESGWGPLAISAAGSKM